MSEVNFESIQGNWKAVQKVFSRVAALPANEAAFEERYGELDDSESVRTFVKAAHSLAVVSRALGNAAVAKQGLAVDGGSLTGERPPVEAYGHLLWVVQLLGNTAGDFASSLGSLSSGQTSPGSRAERAADVQQLLAGDGGLAPKAETVRQIRSLMDKLAPYESEARLLENVNKLSDAKVINLANERIGKLQVELPDLSAELDQAEKEARGVHILKSKKTTAAAADVARKKLEDAKLDIARKQHLVADMAGFAQEASDAVRAFRKLGMDLEAAGQVFGRAADLFRSTASAGDDCGDIQWLKGALGLDAAVAEWKSVAAGAKAFLGGSLID